MTRPGVPSAHLGNSIERLRASSASPPSVAAGGANPLTLGPYIKIIARRNRWPTPDARAHLGRGAAAARGGERPAQGWEGQARRPGSRQGGEGLSPGGGELAARVRERGGEGVPGQNPELARGRPRLEQSLASGAGEGAGARPAACARVRGLYARVECAHVCVVGEGSAGSVLGLPP